MVTERVKPLSVSHTVCLSVSTQTKVTLSIYSQCASVGFMSWVGQVSPLRRCGAWGGHVVTPPPTGLQEQYIKSSIHVKMNCALCFEFGIFLR